MQISVIIPTHDSQMTMPALLDSIMVQNYDNFEIIVIDDCSTDDTVNIISNYEVKLIKLDKNCGPAVSRNIGVENANGDILAFTDSDCRTDKEWLRNIGEYFLNNGTDALMGKLIINRSDYLGDSISLLGFPAGGALGFDKVWKVDNNGFTTSLSSCNCAIKKDVFDCIGGFDETFPYPGGEDSFLAYSLIQSGYKIKYCPDVMVYHEARNSLRGFLKWQFQRGISSYLFSSKVKNRTDYFSLRLWSVSNVIKHSLIDKKLPLIISLLFIGYLTQSIGFLYGRKRSGR